MEIVVRHGKVLLVIFLNVYFLNVVELSSSVYCNFRSQRSWYRQSILHTSQTFLHQKKLWVILFYTRV